MVQDANTSHEFFMPLEIMTFNVNTSLGHYLRFRRKIESVSAVSQMASNPAEIEINISMWKMNKNFLCQQKHEINN